MSILPLTVALIVVLLPFDWLSAILLIRFSHRNPDIAALRERAIAAVLIAVASSFGIVAAANALGGYPVMAPPETQIAVRLGWIILGFAPLRWLWLYWRGR